METTAFFTLLGFLGLNFLAATAGAVFRPGDWYENLRRPSWRPPNRLFGPVWAVLYAMIAVSGWLVFEAEGRTLTPAMAAYLAQLILNWGWSAVFFGLRRPGLAAAEIVALWLSIAVTIVLFQPIDGVAAALLLPYLAWVSFAAALNIAIWRMNRPGAAA